MELPRSLRGICGDQRGTDSVSAGREERRRDCYSEGLRLAGVGSSQTLEGRWTLTGLRKDTNHITRQTKAKWKTGLACVISTHAGFPGSGSQRAFETKRAVQKTEHRFHLLSAQCVPGMCCWLTCLSLLHHRNNPEDRGCQHPHLTDEETESWRQEVICSRSYTSEAAQQL